MEGIASLIVATATLITAIGAVVVGIKNKNLIHDVHVSIDGRMDQLLKSHGMEMKAEGFAQERATHD